MNNTQFFKMNVWKGLLAVTFALVFMALTTGAASAGDYPTPGEEGPYCVTYTPYFNNDPNCTANDVRIEKVYVRTVSRTCSLLPGQTVETMDAVLELLVAQPSGAPGDRFDVGLFLATQATGTTAKDGNMCYHSYLGTTLNTNPIYGDYNVDSILDIYNIDYGTYTFTGWLNSESTLVPADTCGDIIKNRQLIVNIGEQTIPCRDQAGGGNQGNDPNNILDVSVCVSWDNQSDANCTDLTTAYPNLASKCSCQIVDLYGPTAIEGLSFSVKNNALPTGLILSALGLVLIGGVLLSLYLRRRIHA